MPPCARALPELPQTMLPGKKIGTTFSYSPIEPATGNAKDLQAANRIDALLNRLFLESAMGKGYPVKELKFLERIDRYFINNDDKLMAFDPDFIGLQNYTREKAVYSFWVPLLQANIIPAVKRGVPLTEMQWENYPASIYHCLKKIHDYGFDKEIIITESGAAFNDELINGAVNDDLRRYYLEDHLEYILKAKKEGVNVNGFFIWSLLDNFEWAEGYRPRFGIVFHDYKNHNRVIKKSGYWYRDFLNGSGYDPVEINESHRTYPFSDFQ